MRNLYKISSSNCLVNAILDDDDDKYPLLTVVVVEAVVDDPFAVVDVVEPVVLVGSVRFLLNEDDDDGDSVDLFISSLLQTTEYNNTNMLWCFIHLFT